MQRCHRVRKLGITSSLNTERQSVKLSQKFVTTKEVKGAPSSGKVMLTAFWDVNGEVHSEFMPVDATINSERYVRTLKK
jgi:hypothetical protein